MRESASSLPRYLPLRTVFTVQDSLPHRSFLAVQLLLFLSLCFLYTRSGSQVIDTGESSVIAPLASGSLLLDGAAVGGRYFVVGERGHILVSTDGEGWKQVMVPTRSTLTCVYFIDEHTGWAVGHDAVILRTSDGGNRWNVVHYAPEEQKPLFDVWFRDAQYGIAVGAYGYYLVTRDGGNSWNMTEFNVSGKARMDESDREAEPVGDEFTGQYQLHLYDIAMSDSGYLYIAAEAGRIYRSGDSGVSWEELPSPYAGTLFGVLPSGADTVFVYGLRGHLYRSDNAGTTWRQLQTGTTEMLTDAMRVSDGKLVITGLGGAFLVSDDDGASFTLQQQENRKGYSAIMEKDAANLITVGDGGISRIQLTGDH